MKHWIISSTIMALFLGCSSSDQQTSSSTQQSPGPAQSTPLPTAAATMDNKLRAGMVSNMPRVARLEGMLVGIFNPGTPLAQSVTMTPDAGGPPNSFTFTIDNTGWFGSNLTMPIINVPEVAILTMEAITKRAVVLETPDGDVIAIRPVMNMVLAIDHRANDGAEAAAFLRTIKNWLEAIGPDTPVY